MKKWMICISADEEVSLFERVLIAILKHLTCAVEALLTAILTALYLVPKAYETRGYWAVGGEWAGVVFAFGLTYSAWLKIYELEVKDEQDK